jgi:ABC-2 type transport system ATP-binding protein
VREGEVFGLLGPNGAGKTTLIKILCTLIFPSAGTASVNGYDVLKESKKVRESIGYVTTDERSFYWRLTGRQNLEFFANLHNYYSSQARERVSELLEIVNLENRADDPFLSYSAGTKQRLAIARGLINDPQVLFMDEPTRSLDPKAAQSARDFISSYIVKEHEKTIFLSTHNLSEAEQLCNRIAILDDGKIKIAGSPQDLKSSLGNDSTLCDVFSSYSGKKLEEEILPKSSFMKEIRQRHRGGFGGMRR